MAQWDLQVEGRWSYWRPQAAGLIELALVEGRKVALPAHFHSEHQVTFVLAGCRHFLIRGQAVRVEQGDGIVIPAGVPHRSLNDAAGVRCINAYVPAGEYAERPLVHELARIWAETGRLTDLDLQRAVQAHFMGAQVDGRSVQAEDQESVSGAAARHGQTREWFTRRFAKEYGMPPYAYWKNLRLNAARSSLRRGAALATVALDAGFADQSHFGHVFRRTFGTTPGRFQAAVRSQTF